MYLCVCMYLTIKEKQPMNLTESKRGDTWKELEEREGGNDLITIWFSKNIYNRMYWGYGDGSAVKYTAVLPRDWNSAPSTYLRNLIRSCNSSSRSDTSSLYSQPYSHAYIQRHMHIDKNKSLKVKGAYSIQQNSKIHFNKMNYWEINTI